jgi:hypothetical protein
LPTGQMTRTPFPQVLLRRFQVDTLFGNKEAP